MAQKHNSYEEQPMTRYGTIQGPSRRYRRLRHPSFPAAVWAAKNPLLQRGELGVEIDTHQAKIGDGTTYWNDLPYALYPEYHWGDIVGDIDDQTDLKDALDGLQGQITDNKDTMDGHIADKNNPHEVTKAQVGLGNVDNTSDLDKPISTATQTALDDKANSADLATVATSGDYDDLLNKPTIGNATLTIQKNGTAVDTFTANATADKTINIVVPTQASDVNALPDSTKYTANVSMTINSSTYVITLQLKDQDGNDIGTAQTIDLPLETVVVSGSYDSATKEVVLTLKDGSTIRFSVADLISGLQSEITVNNKLDADLVSDSTSTNKFVTASDKTTWNGKQDALTAGTNITISSNTISATDTTYTGSDGITLTGTNFTNSGVRSVAGGTTNGTISVNTGGTTADVAVTGLGSAAYTASSAYATSVQGALADTAVQPGDLAAVATSGNYSDLSGTPSLATVATTGDYDDLLNKPTIPAAQVNSDWNAASGVAQILNKPTLGTMAAESASDYTPTSGLATVATTGNYSDLSGTPSLATVATSGSYNDLSNKPTIPTVNDATLTIQKNGTSVATFTANASSGVTANITVPTTTNDLTNNSGFITSSDIPVTDVTVGGTSVVTSGVAAVPSIPTVNNPTITITQGGVTKGSFTLNQASGDTIALDAGGGSSLPSQTGNAGKFLTTDGTDASWSDKPLVNTATGTYSLTIAGTAATVNNATNVGVSSSATKIRGTAFGAYAAATGTGATACGYNAQATSSGSLSIGVYAKTTAGGAIQMVARNVTNYITNSDANTFKVANANGNFEIMSANGTIPEARLADTTSAAQGQVLTLDSNLDAVWATPGGGSSLDAGFIAPFAGSTAPSGWLVCDGSAVSRSTYSDLFDAIGTTYGSGDGSTTFNLPDLSGKLPLYDSGATLGTTTNGKAPNITYSASGNIGYLYNPTGALQATAGQGKKTTSNGTDWNYYSESFDASRSSSVYDNNATGITPAGVYTLWCIKY